MGKKRKVEPFKTVNQCLKEKKTIGTDKKRNRLCLDTWPTDQRVHGSSSAKVLYGQFLTLLSC